MQGYLKNEYNHRRMKYKPRKGLVSNATGTYTYNPLTHEGKSYNWWVVCKVIEGLPIFNNAFYSITTRGHQSQLMSLFSRYYAPNEIIEIEAPRGLQEIEKSIEIVLLLLAELNRLEGMQEKGRKRSRAYQYRQRRIDRIKQDIERIKKNGSY